MVVCELHQLAIALSCRLDGDLVEDTTSPSIDHGRGVGMDVGVDADDDIDHLAQSDHQGGENLWSERLGGLDIEFRT